MDSQSPEHLKIALIQMYVVASKEENLQHAEQMVSEAAQNGAKLIVLPEFFNAVIGLKSLMQAQEDENGETCQRMSHLANTLNIILVAGSIPMKEGNDDRLLNTCKVFGSDGSTLCTYNKLHLVDGCDFGRGPGIILYETKVIRPGNTFVTFQAGEFKICLGVCYDLKYPELLQIYNQRATIQVVFSEMNTISEARRKQDLNRMRRTDLYTLKDLTL